MLTINTKNILFILGGAFVGLDEVVNKRINNKPSMGFNGNPEKTKTSLTNVVSQDVIKWGMIPELVGRMPQITVLEELTEEQLVRAMTEPKNSIISQFETLFKMDNVELNVEDSACRAIARKCISMQLGARGLRSELETVLLKTQFVLPDLAAENVVKVTLTEETVTEGKEPVLLYGTKRKKSREQSAG
jgi:ATP-dependent Clp protease ATP-binding subunit ClpX